MALTLIPTASAAAITPVAKETVLTKKQTISKRSIEQFAATKRLCVYGFQHCKYTPVAERFKAAGIAAIDWAIGNEDVAYAREDQSRAFQVKSGVKELPLDTHGDADSNAVNRRFCKSGLVNFVMEQVRKKRKGEQTDKMIFCIDVSENGGRNPIPLTSENLLSKTKTVTIPPHNSVLHMNKIITHSELRRAFKLCNDPSVDKEIRDVANEVLKFVRVTETTTATSSTEIQTLEREVDDIGGRVKKPVPVEVTTVETTAEIDLVEIPAPWKAADFAVHWNARKAMSPATRSEKAHDWRKQANLQLARLKLETVKTVMIAAMAQFKNKYQRTASPDLSLTAIG